MCYAVSVIKGANMYKLINKDELKAEWVINKWYEKVVFVMGIFWTVLVVVSFLVGFIQGLGE